MKIKVYPIFLSFFIMGFGDVVGTLVGFARESFNISSALAGLLPFLGFVMYGILSVPTGVLQDKKGKKFTLLLGLGIVFFGLLIPVISISQYLYLIFSIFLIGSGITVLQVAGNPVMRDVSEPGKYSRNLSFAQFIKSIGSLSGSLLTVFLLAKWTGLFPIYAITVAAAILAVSLINIEEKEKSEDIQKANLRGSFGMLKNLYVFLMVFSIFLYVGAEVGINSWIATFLNQSYSLDIKSMATLGISFFFTALMIGRLIGTIILNWLSPKIFFLSTSCLAVLGLLLLFIHNKTLSIATIFIIGLSFANIFPLIFSILIDHMPGKSNELSGLMVMAIIGGAIMPLLMGIIADYSVSASFLVPLVSLLFIVCTAFYTLRLRIAKE